MANMLSAVDPGDRGLDVTVAQVLSQAAKDVEQAKLDPEIEAQIRATRTEGERLQIQGTPTIFINDEIVADPTWENVVAAIEKKLGNPVPAAAGTTPAPTTPTTPAPTPPTPAAGATPPATPPS
mgnify:CR=1 FL=1